MDTETRPDIGLNPRDALVLFIHDVQPTKGFGEKIGASPLWLDNITYKENQLCLSCHVLVGMQVEGYKNRGRDFKYKHVREVINLFHIDPAKRMDEYAPKDIMNEAIYGKMGPARLLFVGGSHDILKVYINDTEKNGPTPEYLTLGYCWGKKEFTCLTGANLATFINEIDIEILPATIRDAIQVTRRLGFSYIWIDALCIPQDSKAEWAAESAKMGSVYRNSTIAALGASDSFQGCFTRRNPLCFRDIRIPNSDFVLSSRALIATPGFGQGFGCEFESSAVNLGFIVCIVASMARQTFCGLFNSHDMVLSMDCMSFVLRNSCTVR
ncbi:MAG: hypothetical protein M1839_008072 [Geoglossum umbratile]|nr:MAG: hypothetical protein M1839_008072 [Geoglossum umbratile]